MAVTYAVRRVTECDGAPLCASIVSLFRSALNVTIIPLVTVALRNAMPLTSSPTTTRMYKGKVTRSWEQLPPEVVRYVNAVNGKDGLGLTGATRLVATYFLLDLSVSGYVPRSWDDARLWPNRMVYLVLRDTMQLERLMKVCPTWGTARASIALICPSNIRLINWRQSSLTSSGNAPVRP